MYQRIVCQGRATGQPDVTIVFVPGAKTIDLVALGLGREATDALKQALRRPEFEGNCAQITSVFTDKARYALIGLGEGKEFTNCTARQVASAALNHCWFIKASSARLANTMPERGGAGEIDLAQAAGEAFGLANFTFDGFRKPDTKTKNGPKTLTISVADGKIAQAMQKGLALAESTNFARRLAATPPNVATPAFMAAEAQKLARSAKLGFKVFKGAELKNRKMVGLINVGQASVNAPCLIQLDYKPKGKSRGTVVLVGKTITYDTGGLSLKVNNGMKGMKYDKSGGTNVLGAMHAIATIIKPDCRVIGLLPAAENSISDNAYRPDDIVQYANGVWVEVTNTDAEGRMVLADGLVHGCKEFKPDVVIDLATLTGGVIVALGAQCAGLWCDHDGLRAQIEEAAQYAGEPVWRMPIRPEHKKMMESKHADIVNSSSSRGAHPCQGAAFLSYFVDEGVPWAHIDIAGSTVAESDSAPFAAGPTGFGVRLLASYFDGWQAPGKRK